VNISPAPRNQVSVEGFRGDARRGGFFQQPKNTTPTMNTETPPPLSKAEAVQILTDGRLLASLTPRQKDAVLRAVHLVSRRSAQKERRERNRRARGVHFTPPEVLANPPFAPTPAPLSPDAPPCVPAPETNHATETEAANE